MFAKIKLDYEDEQWLFYTYGGRPWYFSHDELDGYILIKKEYLEEFKKGNKISIAQAKEKELLVLSNATSYLESERYRSLTKEEQKTSIDPEIVRFLTKIVLAYVNYDAIYLKDKITKK